MMFTIISVLILFLVFEMILTDNINNIISIVGGVIILMSMYLISIGFDIFAITIIIVYFGSLMVVFLFSFIFPQLNFLFKSSLNFKLIVYMSLLISSLIFINTSIIGNCQSQSFLEIILSNNVGTKKFTSVLHILVMRFFIFESLYLNILLYVSLLLILIILNFLVKKRSSSFNKIKKYSTRPLNIRVWFKK